MAERGRRKVWAAVLAAGQEDGMAPLTRLLYGVDLPKQFASFGGRRSLLEATVDRLGLIAPARRTVVTVSTAYAGLARRQLERHAEVDLVRQPVNLGTGPQLLLALAHVLARDPEAWVVVAPADQHVAHPERFAQAAWRALAAAERSVAQLALVAVPPEGPSASLGWIVRGAPLPQDADAAELARFVARPTESLARLLFTTGGLWNTLVCAGRAAFLWRLLETTLPDQIALFDAYRASVNHPGADRVLSDVYEDMTPADLGADALANARGLAVVTMNDAGWSDWATPEQVFETLEDSPQLDRLLAELLGATSGTPLGRETALA